ncbi:hypothetical protein ACHQM5_015606 [Ranunculus cassubicifolius]
MVTSCFKIITCSGSDDNVNEDGFERIESKGSTDKRGWSFRKRSDRHRNTVILEDSSGNREPLEATNIDFNAQDTPTIAVSKKDEVIPLSSELSSKAPDALVPLSSELSSKAPEALVLKEISHGSDPSTKNLNETGSLSITKDTLNVDHTMEESFAIVIQAAIRGYLSQKALLKIKNVIKLQAAVRGHLVRNQAVGTLRCVQAITKMQALVRARQSLGIGTSDQSTTPMEKGTNINPSFYSTEKLLANAFARQLLKSTPKKKPMHIKCDPLRPDSSWKWLERWMSASSPDQAHKPQVNTSIDEQERWFDTTTPTCEIASEATNEVVTGTTEFKSSPIETTIDPEHEEKLTENADYFDFPLHKTTTYGDESHPEQTFIEDNTNQTEVPVLDTIPDEPEVDDEQLRHSKKRLASEQPETGSKKIVTGSRKASNPAFVAAQSKFKELSSSTSSTLSLGSTNKDTGAESKLVETIPTDSQTKATDTIMPEDSISHVRGLDSPDRSEIRGGEKENKSKAVEEVIYVNATEDSFPIFGELGKVEIVNGVDSSVPNAVSENPERITSMDQSLPDRSSPEGSPRSHITVPESHDTPSSQVSTKSKRKDSNKSGQSQIRKSKSAEKRSLSSSDMRNSVEKLAKDSKSGKRRNSFGATKTDQHSDQEPRESSSSSTLPSYMQATQSAKAKAQVINSPRSSPDVQDSDLFIKKRHSLPSGNGKLGSPRVSSSPQAQQISKGDQPNPSR